MFQPASVSLSGPAFSFLLYETCTGTVRQNGFLLGEIVHKEITSITDNEQKQVDISKIIKVNSVIPCPSSNYFLRGRVDKDRLHKLLGSNFSKVVAWYKYEPSSSLKFTLKDRALHKQFRELFDVPQDLFSVCFLSMECTDSFASYNYQQSFIRYFNGTFDKLSLYIPNLSESNSTYINSEPASVVCNKILSSIKMDIENTKGVVAVTEIENAVQNYIHKTVTELAEAESTLFNLEEEIALLKGENQHQKYSDAEPVKEGDHNEIQIQDANIFDDPVTPENILHTQSSPEVTRRSQRTKSKSSPSPNTPSMTDSNKRESAIQNDIQSSPEAQRKSGTPKSRGRGRGRKKN